MGSNAENASIWWRHHGNSTEKICVVVSDNGMSPGRCRAIFWTNAVMLLIGPIRTNFVEILITIYIFSFKKMHLKLSLGNWRPFCLAINGWGTVMTKCGLLCRWPCWDGLIHEMFFFQMADPVPDTLLDTYTIHLLEDDEGKHQTHKEVYCKE